MASLMCAPPCKGLVTNYGEGGLQNGKGAATSFSHAEGGAQQVLR